jgi:hypothetical protein
MSEYAMPSAIPFVNGLNVTMSESKSQDHVLVQVEFIPPYCPADFVDADSASP